MPPQNCLDSIAPVHVVPWSGWVPWILSAYFFGFYLSQLALCSCEPMLQCTLVGLDPCGFHLLKILDRVPWSGWLLQILFVITCVSDKMRILKCPLVRWAPSDFICHHLCFWQNENFEMSPGPVGSFRFYLSSPVFLTKLEFWNSNRGGRPEQKTWSTCRTSSGIWM